MAKNPTAPLQKHYDLVVLGSGPGGRPAAVQASKLKKRVLVVENYRIGGACLHTGTIPSKTLREAALTQKSTGPDSLRAIMDHKARVIEAETLVFHEQLQRNGVDFILGTGSFLTQNSLRIQTATGPVDVQSEFVVIATGARPLRPQEIPFDPQGVYDSDTILEIARLPATLAVIGAGVIGCEYASFFAKMGTEVTIYDPRDTFLRSVDEEIVVALRRHFVQNRVQIRLQTLVDKVARQSGKVEVTAGTEKLSYDALLFCMGRMGNTENLDLEKVGLKADSFGLLRVNLHYQTEFPNIYAVGDVIGAPGLAASAAEQGRLATAHAFGLTGGTFPELFPYGIYTIPEISSVGAHEAALTEKKIPYVVGRAMYQELARGKIIQDDTGFLKLLVDKKTRQLLGVHILGTGATELIHIGQVAMSLGAPIDFLVHNVFNYPTLAEAYKVAALHAFNQLRRDRETG